MQLLVQQSEFPLNVAGLQFGENPLRHGFRAFPNSFLGLLTPDQSQNFIGEGFLVAIGVQQGLQDWSAYKGFPPGVGKFGNPLAGFGLLAEMQLIAGGRWR